MRGVGVGDQACRPHAAETGHPHIEHDEVWPGGGSGSEGDRVLARPEAGLKT